MRPGRAADHSPPSSAVVMEEVELYLYPPSGPHRTCNGITLTFTNCNIFVFMTVYIYIYIYRHTHTHYSFVLCNTHCFSTATVVMRMRLNVTFVRTLRVLF